MLERRAARLRLDRMSLSALLLALLQLGCSAAVDTGEDVAGAASESAARADVRAESAALWEMLAPGIARAFADRATRADLLKAWRTSEVTEHKLEFPAFARTSVGAALIATAAVAQGLDATVTLDRVLRSAPVDFYVPGRENRISWRGTSDVIVATNFWGSTQYGFDVEGVRVPIDLRSSALPARPIVMLQPAELKLVRTLLSRDPGETIQDADERGIGMEITDPAGNVPESDRASFAKCTEETCGGGGGPHLTWTYLTWIQTDGICDNGNCLESNEFEFDAVVAAPG